MNLIGTVVAPATAPQQAQPHVFAPCGRKIPRAYSTYFENRLVEKISETGTASIWALVNSLARCEHPDDRSQEREFRLEFLRGLKVLLKRGTVRRLGRKKIFLPGQEPTASERFRNQQSRKVASSNCRAGADDWARQYEPADRPHVSAQLVRPNENQGKPDKIPDLAYYAGHCQSKSVATQPSAASTPMGTMSMYPLAVSSHGPDPEQVSEAARNLRSMPRKSSKRWTGWLHGLHFWRGRLVVLPDGDVIPVMWTCRKRILLQDVLDLPFRDWAEWGARWENQVQPYRNPAAVMLGQRKLGVRERSSQRKADAVRLNGSKPPRPGSRARGRPPRNANSNAEASGVRSAGTSD
jgi:hypothetical protein